MKIQRFNEATKFSDDDYPFKCKFKDPFANHDSDPGICYVIEIYFRNRSVKCSNGADEYYASFDDIEFIPDIFIFSKYNL